MNPAGVTRDILLAVAPGGTSTSISWSDTLTTLASTAPKITREPAGKLAPLILIIWPGYPDTGSKFAITGVCAFTTDVKHNKYTH